MSSTHDLPQKTASSSRWSALWASPLLPCLIFAGLCLLGLLNHEMWRDELRAWVLVQQSSSFAELFQQINNEGHPALWYVCLYGLTRLSSSYLAMQVFHGAIATSIIYIIHRYSPFTLLQRWMLTFSYFFFYEYAIVSRGYSLGVLCLLGFCSCFSSPQRSGIPRNTWLLAGCLALLANTTVYGLLLSLSLAIVMVWGWWQQREQRSPLQQLRHGLGIAVILCSGWAIASFQVTRAMVAEAGQNLEQATVTITTAAPVQVLPEAESVASAKRLIYSLTQIWKAYVPVPLLWQHNFWNTNFIANSPRLDLNDNLPLGLILSALLSLVMALMAVKALWRSRLAVLLYSFGTTTLLLFSYRFAWWTSLRHHGHLFVFLVACFWLLPSLVPAHRLGAMANVLKRSSFFTTLLAIQVFAGVYLYVSDLALPFSGGKAAAAYLEAEQLDGMAIAGHDQYQASTVAIYLDTSFYYPEINKLGFSWDTETTRESNEANQLANLQAWAAQSEQGAILVWSKPLEEQIPDYKLTELETFKSALTEDESFYLYRLSPQ